MSSKIFKDQHQGCRMAGTWKRAPADTSPSTATHRCNGCGQLAQKHQAIRGRYDVMSCGSEGCKTDAIGGFILPDIAALVPRCDEHHEGNHAL